MIFNALAPVLAQCRWSLLGRTVVGCFDEASPLDQEGPQGRPADRWRIACVSVKGSKIPDWPVRHPALRFVQGGHGANQYAQR